MKILRRCFYALTSVALLTACSDDTLQVDAGTGVGNNGPGVEDGVYFTINIDLPSAGGSRSVTGDPDGDGYTTSSDGVEIGQDFENKIGTAIVVLSQTSNNGFIAAAPVTALNDISSNKSAYQATSKFSKTELAEWYNTNPTSFNCNIYIFANPTDEMRNFIFGTETTDAPAIGSTGWINEICNLNSVAEISTKDQFLMSNAKRARREIPHTLNDWNAYSSASHPFNLSGDNAEVDIYNEGAILLERATARFDFRDGSPLYAEDDTPSNAFRYHVVYAGSKESGTPIIDIKLATMSLVNVDKSFYAVRRVSTDGSNESSSDNTVTICGAEMPWIQSGNEYKGGNYIVDATYAWKVGAANTLNGKPNATVDYSGHFFYPFFNNDGTIDNIVNDPDSQVDDYSDSRWLTARCDEVIKGADDNKESWNNSGENGKYKIWTYAVENVIANVDDQINGLSTGVVFKGKMVATTEALNSDDPETKLLAQTINNVREDGVKLGNTDKDPIIYEFGGNLYLTWENIRSAAIAAAAPEVKWVSDDPEDASKGHWELNVNELDRKAPLYVAVFGTGGFGEFEFKYYETDEDKKPIVDDAGNIIYHEGLIVDNLAIDESSADYAWSRWVAAGRPEGKTDALKVAYKKAVTDALITIYQSGRDAKDGWGYYCYYYYWNRHNDNGNNGVMGPMEFAVVRNNVYKLAVSAIDRLGHPRLSENDPNRPTGGTKDETEDVYITVTAQVLPWVVRLNNIEF